MFMGEYQHNVDLKGRLIIPSKFREQLGESCVVTKGLDGCLYLYPQEEWIKTVTKLDEGLNLLKAQDRVFKRKLVGRAEELDLDKQGRILIPANLRALGNIEKDVILVGMMERIEIWDKDLYDEMNSLDDMDEIAESMAERGIVL